MNWLQETTSCPGKYSDEVVPTTDNLSRINLKSLLKHLSVVNLNMNISFEDTDALILYISVLKVCICFHFLTGALA